MIIQCDGSRINNKKTITIIKKKKYLYYCRDMKQMKEENNPKRSECLNRVKLAEIHGRKPIIFCSDTRYWRWSGKEASDKWSERWITRQDSTLPSRSSGKRTVWTSIPPLNHFKLPYKLAFRDHGVISFYRRASSASFHAYPAFFVRFQTMIKSRLHQANKKKKPMLNVIRINFYCASLMTTCNVMDVYLIKFVTKYGKRSFLRFVWDIWKMKYCLYEFAFKLHFTTY